MGRIELLPPPRLLYINPLDSVKVPEAPQWLADVTGLEPPQIKTLNIANGDTLPQPSELYDQYAGIIGGGGKNSANDAEPWVENYLTFLKKLRGTGIPTFGICFSHQAIAKTNGGTVAKRETYRYGVETFTLTNEGKKDPSFDGLPKRFAAFVINGEYATRRPPDSVPLARRQNHHNEALGYEHTTTVQFHPERTDAVMRRLARRRAVELDRPDEMRAAYNQFESDVPQSIGTQAEANGRRIMKNWMEYVVGPYHRSMIERVQRSETVFERPRIVLLTKN